MARAGLGLAALVVPERVARPWVGDGASREEPKLLGRALGGRDLALGLGSLASAVQGTALRSWVAAGALADLVDAGVTIARFGHLPDRGRWVVLASAGGAAILGLAALPGL